MVSIVVYPAGHGVCPGCMGHRGFKRRCGGNLSDWVWESCEECNGSGNVVASPQRADIPDTIEITYEQLYALVVGARGFVAHARRDQRTRGITSWAVARDIDNIDQAVGAVSAKVKAVAA